MSEKYSIINSLHLLIIATICLCQPSLAQEIRWTHRGLGEQPHITVRQSEGQAELVMVGSPMSTRVLALAPKDGTQVWLTELGENVSSPGRLVTDIAFIATHGGSLVALDSRSGSLLWRRQTERLNDFASTQPTFSDGSLYTLSREGVLSRFSPTGERLVSRRVQHRVADWNPGIVPMWRNSEALSFLDQSGRLRTYEKERLQQIAEIRVQTSAGPGGGPSSSEVLAGVYDARKELLWTSELSGVVRATSVKDGSSLWTLELGQIEHLWSEDGRLLAVPILASGDFQKLLIVTRSRALAVDSETGKVEQELRFPSPAVAPPLFDAKRQTWWVVTHDAILEFHWSGKLQELPLPRMEVPYWAALGGDLLVLASRSGKLYALDLKPVK